MSADGRLLPFVLSVPGGRELWFLHLQGTPAPTRYFANGFNLAHPALSPDGRWMAYDSDESGRVEVYAQSFPDPSDRALESLDGPWVGAGVDQGRAGAGVPQG